MSNSKKKNQTQNNNHKQQENVQAAASQQVKAVEAVTYRGIPKTVILSIIKIGIPVLACIIVAIVIVSLVHKKNDSVQQTFEASSEAGDMQETVVEPLQQDAIEAVNALIGQYFNALAAGDKDTIKALKDYVDDTELIKYEKKSEYIESYNNIACYTKPGLTENSYCVYVTYDIKFTGIDTLAPGLNAMYVYTDDSGNMVIDGDMDENITAAMKLVTNQDDVVDLYNKVDVKFKEAVADDEQLNAFLTELPDKIKTAVGVALAQAETSTDSADEDQTQETETEEIPQDTVVNEKVKATDTVNVRSSDSEEADKLGKAQAGMELNRVEVKANGWSKVIYEGKEAYIKSDYLEVISSQDVVTDASSDQSQTIKAKENVNVRKSPDITADKLGVVQAGTSYTLLEKSGEWYKISFNGKEGYVKAEFFE